jgi:hypothetical protein
LDKNMMTNAETKYKAFSLRNGNGRINNTRSSRIVRTKLLFSFILVRFSLLRILRFQPFRAETLKLF